MHLFVGIAIPLSMFYSFLDLNAFGIHLFNLMVLFFVDYGAGLVWWIMVSWSWENI